MLTEQKISWDQAHYLWNDFKLGTEYQQYLFDVYGITVEAGGRVIWNHVFNVIEVIIEQGGAAGEVPSPGKKKPKRKRIKLIFIMGDIEKTIEKDVSSLIAPKIVSSIQNKIQEQVKAKITLSDVQIIKG